MNRAINRKIPLIYYYSHHPSIQYSHIGCTPFRHLLHCRNAHSLNLTMQFRCHTRCGSIRSHTTGIQSQIAIQGTFVILCRGHKYGRLPIAKGKTGCFRSAHVGFNDAGVARGTKGLIAHDFLDCRHSFLESSGKEYALPGGKAGCLDNLTIVGDVEGLDVRNGFIGRRESTIFGSGNVVLLKKVFGECLVVKKRRKRSMH